MFNVVIHVGGGVRRRRHCRYCGLRRPLSGQCKFTCLASCRKATRLRGSLATHLMVREESWGRCKGLYRLAPCRCDCFSCKICSHYCERSSSGCLGRGCFYILPAVHITYSKCSKLCSRTWSISRDSFRQSGIWKIIVARSERWLVQSWSWPTLTSRLLPCIFWRVQVI